MEQNCVHVGWAVSVATLLSHHQAAGVARLSDSMVCAILWAVPSSWSAALWGSYCNPRRESLPALSPTGISCPLRLYSSSPNSYLYFLLSFPKNSLLPLWSSPLCPLGLSALIACLQDFQSGLVLYSGLLAFEVRSTTIYTLFFNHLYYILHRTANPGALLIRQVSKARRQVFWRNPTCPIQTS